MFSVKEGICGAVPMIVMPFFAEQAHNVKPIIWVEKNELELELFQGSCCLGSWIRQSDQQVYAHNWFSFRHHRHCILNLILFCLNYKFHKRKFQKREFVNKFFWRVENVLIDQSISSKKFIKLIVLPYFRQILLSCHA